MRDNRKWIALAAAVCCWSATAPAVTSQPPDVLQFMDGSTLHGRLQRMDSASGLDWSTPDAEGPIRFLPQRLDSIRFGHAEAMNLTPSCHVTFANGDDLFGSLSSLDSDKLEFHTWFGGTISIPRTNVRAVTFLSKNYTIKYEGPYDASGWTIGNATEDGWKFANGAFIGTGAGTLARDLGLTNSATIEFDLAWSGMDELLVDVYSDALDHLEYNSGSYVFGFGPRDISFRHVQTGGIPRNFGTLPLPDLPQKNQMHVAIQCNRTEKSVSIFINNALARKWTDEAGFHGTGTGLLFQIENLTGATVTLSNIKISEWQGAYEPDTSTTATNTDAIHFVNHDQAAGKIAAIKDGKVSFDLAGRTLEIPLQRVTQLNFAGTNDLAERASPWMVRAHFPGGGSLSFELTKWDEETVAGKSDLFGQLAFRPEAIREIEFNLDRPKAPASVGGNENFGDLDE